MENFFVRAVETLDVHKDFIYDNEALIENNRLNSTELCIELPQNLVFMKHLRFDFFCIYSDRTLVRINKYKKKIETIGMMTENILSVEYGCDKIAILTETEVFLFNSYFNLEKTAELSTIFSENELESFKELLVQRKDSSINSKFKIRFSADKIAIILPSSVFLLDFDLQVTNRINEMFSDMAFFPKYNIFACADINSLQIRFFEPNGLEHGDPLCAFGYALDILELGNKKILLVITESGVSGYFMMNFFWYKKFHIPGTFYSKNNNVILIMKPNQNKLYKYYIYRELTTGLVINGNTLYYTNLENSIIPPPFYLRSISVTSQILNFFLKNNCLYIAHRTGITLFNIDKDDNITPISCFNLPELEDAVFVDLIEQLNKIFLNIDGYCFQIDDISKDVDNLTCNKIHTCDKKLLRIYDLGESIGILYFNGLFAVRNSNIAFSFDPRYDFDLKMNSDHSIVCFLNNGLLQTFPIDTSLPIEQSLLNLTLNSIATPQVDRSTVLSYIVHSDYILKRTKKNFKIDLILPLSDCKKIETKCVERYYLEEGMEPLFVKENSILFYTRFGTLETVTNKLFSTKIITKLIDKEKIKAAASKCDRNHIDYSIFLENPVFKLKHACDFDSSQVLSLFHSMKFTETRMFLQNEYVDLLDLNFNPDFVLRNACFDVTESSCFLLESLSHIFKDFTNIPLKVSSTNNIKNIEPLQHSIENMGKSSNVSFKDTSSHSVLINELLKNLQPQIHFSAIINIFLFFGRVDLCFYLGDIQKVVKVLLTKLSPETICKASMMSFDLEKIALTHKICQRDYASFLSFYNSSNNIKFSVLDYLEDMKSALFYLVKDTLATNPEITADSSKFSVIADYVVKNSLFDQLLLYTFHNIFPFNFYEFVAKHKEPLDAFYLNSNAGNVIKALEIAKKELFWAEALNLEPSPETSMLFIELLVQNSRLADAAEILERYLGDYSTAIEFYLKDRKMLKALNTYKGSTFVPGDTYDGVKKRLSKDDLSIMIKETAIAYLKTDLISIKAYLDNFEKYKQRLESVRSRLSENIRGSQTTFSYSSMRSSKKALIKDRPGGIFENEYVMNKLRTIALDINAWRLQADELLSIFDEFGEDLHKNYFLKVFEPIKLSLKKDIEEVWHYKRVDVDIEMPVVPKPELSTYFN
ncbi:putative elongator complex protein 1 [Glugoides intestinalis]